jgi:mRNA-degrading endonuclease toxin of MazEF toxin-antitoxin module
MPPPRIRQGQIYWLDDCVPLDGNVDKSRPVVVISTPEQIKAGVVVLVAACTTHPRPKDPRRFKIVDRTVNPTTGLSKTCWALPRWYLLVNPFRLKTLAGNCPSDVLARLIAAVLVQVENDRQ